MQNRRHMRANGRAVFVSDRRLNGQHRLSAPRRHVARSDGQGVETAHRRYLNTPTWELNTRTLPCRHPRRMPIDALSLDLPGWVRQQNGADAKANGLGDRLWEKMRPIRREFQTHLRAQLEDAVFGQ